MTQTLKNAIITKQTSHAYLFTGPARGTGKRPLRRFLPRRLIVIIKKMVNLVMNVKRVGRLLPVR